MGCDVTVPRGLRNNNPGNLRHGDKWEGLAKDQSDPAFATFISPIYGIRAMAIVLRNYQRKHKCKTLADFIRRWAPPNENDTTSYIAAVARECALTPSAKIDVDDADVMAPLIAAIIRHENGKQPYTDLQIRAALNAAGIHAKDTDRVEPPQPSVGPERQEAGGAGTSPPAAPGRTLPPEPAAPPIQPATRPGAAPNPPPVLSRQPDQEPDAAPEPEPWWRTLLGSKRVKAGLALAGGSQVPGWIDSLWETCSDWFKNDPVAVETLWQHATTLLAIKWVGYAIFAGGAAWLVWSLYLDRKTAK